MNMQSNSDGNESMYVDLLMLFEVSKALRASFGGISSAAMGTIYHQKGAADNPIDCLNHARHHIYEDESLYKYGFPAAIDHVKHRVETANKKLVDIGEYLYWVLEKYEETESSNVLRLKDYKLLDQSDVAWTAAYGEPLGILTYKDPFTWQKFGGYTVSSKTGLAQSGFLYRLFGPGDWDFPFADTAEGMIGIDASLLTQKDTTIIRTPTGERRVTFNERKFGTLAFAFGTDGAENIHSKNKKAGWDTSVGLFGMTEGEIDLDAGQTSEVGGTVGGLGTTLTVTKYEDGTQGVDTSVFFTDFGIHTRVKPDPNNPYDEEMIRAYGQAGLID